jgi:hypothetical protein
MREEPDCVRSLALAVAQGRRDDRTYDFIAAKFDEGVKKRTNPGKAGCHYGILRVGGDENFDMALEGLDDREYCFFKVRIQEIRLLLEAIYLHIEGRSRC